MVLGLRHVLLLVGTRRVAARREHLGALLALQIEDDALALVGDDLHRPVQQRAGIALDEGEHVARQILGVRAHQRRLVRRDGRP